MHTTQGSRGFRFIHHQEYTTDKETRLVWESSAIDFDTPDGLDNPGSSYLWIGKDHHLNREEVAQLRDALTHWLEHKRLPATM
jgi:hypothetical protein